MVLAEVVLEILAGPEFLMVTTVFGFLASVVLLAVIFIRPKLPLREMLWRMTIPLFGGAVGTLILSALHWHENLEFFLSGIFVAMTGLIYIVISTVVEMKKE